MMSSLMESSLGTVVKKQYIFKLQTYANLFVSLAAVQLIAMLFTAGGIASTGMGSNNLYVLVKIYSGTGIFGFTVLWIMVNSLILMFPQYRNIDFTFVTNRISSNLANMGFMVTAAAAGGITAVLGSLLLRNIFYYAGGSEYLLNANNFYIGPAELFSSMGVAVLYLLLSSAAGYLAGALVQLHKSLYVILPALLLGLFIYESANEQIRIFRRLDFFFLERSPLLFTLKIMISVLLLWACAVLLSNRTEVR